MSDKSLAQIEESIERLDLQDQARLLQYLAPKVVGALLASTREATATDVHDAWIRYRAVADRLAATSSPTAQPLTGAVSEMRR